ncbi:MAG: DNA repair protein RecN [Acidimicrobiales bacterium]
MLVELTVRDLGVIDDLTLVLGPGMTALTGETGAGKTLVVEAIDLLVGGRPDPVMVRPGAAEAWVEGRFATDDGGEVILARAVPASGRSRAYVDGKMAPVGSLAEWGTQLVDLHGQHAHQSLLSPAVQRHALDHFGGIDRRPFDTARAQVRTAEADLTALGGDSRGRAREVDLLRYQLDEIDNARLDDPDEEARLAETEAILADAGAWREAAVVAYDALVGEGGAGEQVAVALGALHARAGAVSPFSETLGRLVATAAELADVAADVRSVADGIPEDPQRLAALQDRRHLLRELRRKYGDTLAEVIAFGEAARQRLAELESYDDRVAVLEARRTTARAAVAKCAAEIAARRRACAPALGASVETHLRELALPRARFEVSVDGDDPGDDVVFGFSANPGEPVLPLAKVASGGELARVMLAARLVLTAGPPTLVFDEVDAGIGGAAALAVAESLARLGGEASRQVFVVTHLAQVAAFADAQVAVVKDSIDGRTVARAGVVSGEERIRELGRMLSGQPDSAAARDHAAELLGVALRRRRER